MEPYEPYEPWASGSADESKDPELRPRRRSVRSRLLRVASFPSMILTALVGQALGLSLFGAWLAAMAVAFAFGVMIGAADDAPDLADSPPDH